MEVWDIYDINRNRIDGRTSVRGSDDMKDDEFHIVVFAVVCNSDGKLLCSMRDRNKMFGGTWEFCGGSAITGETSRQAAERELLEETGLDVRGCEGRVVATNTKYWPGSNWFYDVWLFESEFDTASLTPQEGEVEKIDCFGIDQVKELLRQNNFTGITSEFIDKIEENIKNNFFKKMRNKI